MKQLSVLVLSGALFFSGCDALRRIDMKNATGDTVRIIWMATDDSIGFNPFILNNSKELCFTLPPGVRNNVRLSFGSGSWTPDYVQHLMKYLVSLQIQSANHQLIFSTPDSISSFLLAHRKGMGKRIEITVMPQAFSMPVK